ncbi:pyridoxamine 5'-phosphate oxidase family protein [bacterium]|nr:MAG: pyridoxamine 5'-phosphate oxidase family protein [bacterium]
MKLLPGIDANLAEWIGKQHVFFVGTAPLSPDGHVNVSPKGGDSFRILGEREVAYLDFTGSGAETAAHVRENGRIVIMFCAFEGKPEIVRLHGRAELIDLGHEDFRALAALFPPNPGTRAVFRIKLDRVSTSCGYAVPFMDFREERHSLDKWAKAKGPDGLVTYRKNKNEKSIDGLPALPLEPI